MNDVDTLLREAYKMGWVRVMGGKHYKLVHPCGATVIISRTASDRRAMLNIRADLRRAMRQRGIECKI